jgi:hypothetical protein
MAFLCLVIIALTPVVGAFYVQYLPMRRRGRWFFKATAILYFLALSEITHLAILEIAHA